MPSQPRVLSRAALIGMRIRQWRQKQKLSQREVAERMGVSYQQWQKYETGFNHISSSRLVEFCEAYNVSPFVFLRPQVEPEKTFRDDFEEAYLMLEKMQEIFARLRKQAESFAGQKR